MFPLILKPPFALLENILSIATFPLVIIHPVLLRPRGCYFTAASDPHFSPSKSPSSQAWTSERVAEIPFTEPASRTHPREVDNTRDSSVPFFSASLDATDKGPHCAQVVERVNEDSSVHEGNRGLVALNWTDEVEGLPWANGVEAKPSVVETPSEPSCSTPIKSYFPRVSPPLLIPSGSYDETSAPTSPVSLTDVDEESDTRVRLLPIDEAAGLSNTRKARQRRRQRQKRIQEKQEAARVQSDAISMTEEQMSIDEEDDTIPTSVEPSHASQSSDDSSLIRVDLADGERCDIRLWVSVSCSNVAPEHDEVLGEDLKDGDSAHARMQPGFLSSPSFPGLPLDKSPWSGGVAAELACGW